MWRSLAILGSFLIDRANDGLWGDFPLLGKSKYRHGNLLHMSGEVDGEFLPAVADVTAEFAWLVSGIL